MVPAVALDAMALEEVTRSILGVEASLVLVCFHASLEVRVEA